MLNREDIDKLVIKMTDDVHFNLNKIKKLFGSLKYTDNENQSLLHIFVDNKYDEVKCFLAIKSLLQTGLNPNLESDFNYNFIQTALYTGYSESFILNIITEALKYNLDVNHVDSDMDTIMHTAIYSDDYLGEIEKIYELLSANGYDSTKVCSEGRNLVEAMVYQKQYTSAQIENFEKLFHEKTKSRIEKQEKIKTTNTSNITKKIESSSPGYKILSKTEILELERYGIVLNNKNYLVSPTIGREKELKNLMVTLAQEKKHPLIVGESGVGKTSLVDELAFRIKTGQVPSFLLGKIILEVVPSEIVTTTQYRGQFEEKMTKLIKLCLKDDVILFIDEIHTIYGTGSAKNNENDMASMLKHYIDRSNLKVIGTTTDKEYDKFFGDDALKRRFEKIVVKEPNKDILYQIINKVIGDYYLKSGILFKNENIKEQIVNIILDATEKSCRVYNDIVNNPDLSLSIVDKAFALAKVYDSEFIDENHFIESFELCNRIYDSASSKAITKLKNLDNNISKSSSKILRLENRPKK